MPAYAPPIEYAFPNANPMGVDSPHPVREVARQEVRDLYLQRRSFAVMDRALRSRLELERVIVPQMMALLQEEDDDEGIFRPTTYALRVTLNLLQEAYAIAETLVPRASVASDGEGGIYVYWRRPGRDVQLAIPAQPSGQTYIYHQTGDDYAVERSVSATSLAYWLDWFARA